MVDDAKPAFDVVGTSKVLARIGSKFGLVTFLVSVIAAIGFEENGQVLLWKTLAGEKLANVTLSSTLAGSVVLLTDSQFRTCL